jgi:cephalosporin-C deacetylase
VKLPKIPTDFDKFWADTLVELEQQPLMYKQFNERELCQNLQYANVEYLSLHSTKIMGFSCIWHDKPRPLIIFTNGYNGQYKEQLSWAKTGVNVLGFDTRGFGRSAPYTQVSGDGHILTGIQTPHESILRGAVCDFIQAEKLAKKMIPFPASKVIFYGFSFSGGMAIQAAAVSQRPDIVVSGVPTFAWHEKRNSLPIGGSAAEVQRFLRRNPDKRNQVMSTLNYFDTLHFAEKLRCPTLIGIGLEDTIVPSETVFPITAKLQNEHQLRIFAKSHSEEDDIIWQPFINEMMLLAKEGLFQTEKGNVEA